MEHGDLNHVEIQALIEYVNTEVQEENDCKFVTFLYWFDEPIYSVLISFVSQKFKKSDFRLKTQ